MDFFGMPKSLNYLTRDKGGRGLRSLEDTYTAKQTQAGHQATPRNIDFTL